MQLVRQNEETAGKANFGRGSGRATAVRCTAAALVAAALATGCAAGPQQKPAAEGSGQHAPKEGAKAEGAPGHPARAAEKPEGAHGEKPAGAHAEKPAKPHAGKPAEPHAGKPGKPAEKPARKPAAKPAAKPAQGAPMAALAALPAGVPRGVLNSVPQGVGQAAAGRVVDYAASQRVAQTARLALAKRWGLAKAPILAPAPPAQKPVIRPRKGFEVDDQAELGLPPVFTTVPTKDKVVFLTIDDGSEKDPAFLKMMSELHIPYTAFLTNQEIQDDYGYFKKAEKLGVTLNNHTLTHPYLPGLSYAEQRHEICGMQKIMKKQYGKAPTMMRPPFGNYNEDTLKAAKSCGIKYAPIWNAEVFVDKLDYREEDRDIHPGDIILTHFRGRDEWKGTMPDMVRKFMKYVTDKGYAVARLEDYL